MSARSDTAKRVAPHRQLLRAQGLRPIQIWVSDTHTRTFAQAARRQARAVAASAHAAEDQAFIDAISGD